MAESQQQRFPRLAVKKPELPKCNESSSLRAQRSNPEEA